MIDPVREYTAAAIAAARAGELSIMWWALIHATFYYECERTRRAAMAINCGTMGDA